MSTVPSRIGGILCVLMSSEAHVVIVAIWLEETGLLHRSALSGWVVTQRFASWHVTVRTDGYVACVGRIVLARGGDATSVEFGRVYVAGLNIVG